MAQSHGIEDEGARIAPFPGTRLQRITLLLGYLGIRCRDARTCGRATKWGHARGRGFWRYKGLV